MTLPLFDEPAKPKKNHGKVVDAKASSTPFSVTQLAESLVHPFPRYGLAVAISFYSGDSNFNDLTETKLREILAQAIEGGLNAFRMETESNPQYNETLHFQAISLEKLQKHKDLVQGNLSAKGKYLYPSVITRDRGAGDTFEEAMKIVNNLRDPKVPLARKQEMKRSFAPIMGEINNGGNEKKNEKGTLFEAACTAIATVCYEKPSAYVQETTKSPDPSSKTKADTLNTAIFPDLDLEDLCRFIKVFHLLQITDKNLTIGKPSADKNFKRPPLHDGNYPYAPREAYFGAVGLLAAIGYWATRAENTDHEATVAALDSLKDCALYVVNYNQVFQVCFSSHVVDLAKRDKDWENLRNIIDQFYHKSVLYAGMPHGRPVHFARYGNSEEIKELKSLFFTYRHFYRAFSRFLQRFDLPSFQDFLAFRAEYPPSARIVIGVFFMKQLANPVPERVVKGVSALGRHINSIAYRAADEDVEPQLLNDPDGHKRAAAIRKKKSQILAGVESIIMSAKSPVELIGRVSSHAGRTSYFDAPPEAEDFYDAVSTSRIDLHTAQYLLIAYLRLRAPKTPNLVPSNATGDAESDADKSNYDEEPQDES